MANLNPSQHNDFRNHIDNPDLRTRDILIWIVEEGIDEDFTARDIAVHFKIETTAVSPRMKLLKQWGCAKIAKRGKGTIPSQWQITKYGHKKAEEWSKEEVNEKDRNIL